MNILVTGCHGKIGLATCRLLMEQGHRVHGMDHDPSPHRAHPVTIESLVDPAGIHRALEAAGHATDPIDAVIHLAGHTNARVAPASTVLRENQTANTNLFLAAARAGIPRIVFCSSIQAMLGGIDSGPDARYTRPPRFPLDETIEPCPSNVYGLSKLLAEQTLDHITSPRMRLGWDDHAVNTTAISLRIPFVLNEQSLQWSLKHRRHAEYEWGGAEAFAYLALDDAASALALAATCPADRIDGHEICLAVAPDPRPADSVAELVDRFYADVPGTDIAIARDSFVDCARARTLLGWAPTRILREMRSSQPTQ